MKTLLIALTLTACATAQAQTVYRCGPDGRQYSQTPCAQGRAVDVSDERSPQQRQEALDVADRERALGDALAFDRLALESKRPAMAGHIDGRTAHAPAHSEPAAKKKPKKRHGSKHDQPERYRAVAPAASPKKA